MSASLSVADRAHRLCDRSKLFTITFSINMIMFGFAVSGHWHYATKYAGAFAVANFNVSILMRNEIFGRCLYWLVNTLFAKVRRHILV